MYEWQGKEGQLAWVNQGSMMVAEPDDEGIIHKGFLDARMSTIRLTPREYLESKDVEFHDLTHAKARDVKTLCALKKLDHDEVAVTWCGGVWILDQMGEDDPCDGMVILEEDYQKEMVLTWGADYQGPDYVCEYGTSRCRRPDLVVPVGKSEGPADLYAEVTGCSALMNDWD